MLIGVFVIRSNDAIFGVSLINARLEINVNDFILFLDGRILLSKISYRLTLFCCYFSPVASTCNSMLLLSENLGMLCLLRQS